MTEEEEFEFRHRLEQEQSQAVPEMQASEVPIEEPSGLDLAKSYGASALSGVTALPRGAAQLGVNIGETIPDWLKYEFTGERPNEGIELTEPVKQQILESGGELPQYQEPDIYPTSISGQQQIVEELKKKAGREGFDWTELAGMIASPTTLMKTGVAKGAGFLPKIGEGAKVGALYGAGMPVTGEGDFAKEKVTQALLGAGLGGAVPAIGEPLKAVGRGIDQFTRPMSFRNTLGQAADYASGKMGGIQRDLQEIVGDMLGANRGKVVQAMSQARERPISGMPTAGQAVAGAQRPGERFGTPLARLEKEVAQRPETSDIMNTAYQRQQAARAKELGQLAGTPETMAALKAERAAVADPLYKAVEESTARVNVKPVVSQIDDLIAKNRNNDKVVRGLIDAKQKLTVGGKIEDSPVALKSLSDDLSTKINAKNPQTGASDYDVKTLTQIKKEIDKRIGQEVPEYRMAQKKYAEMSEPLEQAKIAQAVKDKIGVDIGDQSIKPFLKAMNDQAKLIKGATGYKRGKDLESIYKRNPEALKTLKNVVDELETELTAGKMAKEVTGVFGDVRGGVEQKIPGMLERSVVLANALLSKITKDKTGEYAKELARLMQNPNEFAALLNAPASSPLVINTMAMFNQISKAAPMEAAKIAGE